ncbi:MAG: hypothetical protein AAF958_05085, partial [Planctomycetota bacterium]
LEATGTGVSAGSVGRSQWMMVAGFLLLGWVLARRTIRNRRTSRINNRAAEKELQRARNPVAHSVPLSDAPPDVQRWQVALYETQRDLSAELDTRISVVKALLAQVDQLSSERDSPSRKLIVEPESRDPPRGLPVLSGDRLRRHIADSLKQGETPEQIAVATGIPLGEIQWTIASMTPNAKVPQASATPK